MSKYRFKTVEEFKESGDWTRNSRGKGIPSHWNDEGSMDRFYGQEIPDEFNEIIEAEGEFSYDGWVFRACECVEIPKELTEEELEQILNQVKEKNNSLITKKMKNAETKTVKRNPVAEKFVFMDKTVNILNVGFMTGKNVVLFGPGE